MLRGASFCLMSGGEIVSEAFERQMCAIEHQEVFTGDSSGWMRVNLHLISKTRDSINLTAGWAETETSSWLIFKKYQKVRDRISICVSWL